MTDEINSREYQCFLARARVQLQTGKRPHGSIYIPVDLVEFLKLKHRDYLKVLIRKMGSDAVSQ